MEKKYDNVAPFSVLASIFRPKFVVLLPYVTLAFELNECF